MPESQAQKIIAGLGGAARMAIHMLLPFLHAGRIRWGATDEELARSWPGDELVPNPRAGFMHAITIQAPASAVYAWVAQIGQNKAGFYSYEALENIAGCQMRNTYHLVPEWQQLAPGDVMLLHPQVPMPVLQVEPGRYYLTGCFLDGATGQLLDPAAPRPPGALSISWLFYACDLPGGSCRFISRWRVGYAPSFKSDLLYGRWLMEPVAHVMDVRMLQTLRRCAESWQG